MPNLCNEWLKLSHNYKNKRKISLEDKNWWNIRDSSYNACGKGTCRLKSHLVWRKTPGTRYVKLWSEKWSEATGGKSTWKKGQGHVRRKSNRPTKLHIEPRSKLSRKGVTRVDQTRVMTANLKRRPHHPSDPRPRHLMCSPKLSITCFGKD